MSSIDSYPASELSHIIYIPIKYSNLIETKRLKRSDCNILRTLGEISFYSISMALMIAVLPRIHLDSRIFYPKPAVPTTFGKCAPQIDVKIDFSLISVRANSL